MSHEPRVSRRSIVAAGMALGAGAVSIPCPADEQSRDGSSTPVARPVAQDYTVLTETDDKNVCTCGPGIARAPDGSLLATVPYWWRAGPKRPGVVHILCSGDGGETWERLRSLEYFTAMPWTHDGALYLFAHRDGRGRYRNDDLALHRSEDCGQTWSEPLTLFEGHFWNCPTGIVVHNGHVYRAFDQLDVPGRAERVVAGDLSRDLMDPAAWRILMLMYSIDALNWFQAGCIAMAPKLRQSFMYASLLVDGQDMLVLSRTSREGQDQHDADQCTFHRVRDFRRLAHDLYPEV